MALAFALAVVGASACEEGAHRDIQDEINILTRRNDALVPPATDRLAKYGRLAIPQIETAMLVRRGLPTRQIANELGISVNTARRHVERILLKLDVNNRTAAAAKISGQ